MIPILIPDLPITEQLLPWLQRIDKARWYSNFGPLIQEFESQLISTFFSKQSTFLTTVSSGTTALELALSVLNLSPGRYALTPALTFPATAIAIKQAGLSPIFTDIDPHTWLLTPEIAYQVLKKKSFDVVIPVATFGCPQPVEQWDKFSEETGIPVLIDAAAAIGHQAIGQYCITTFSFHATKPFGIGEGGLVVAKSADFIKKVRKLSNFGFEEGIITQYGSNAKLSEYHAAVGLAQLKRWPQIIKHRQQIWQIYQQHFNKIQNKIHLQQTPQGFIPTILSVKINKLKKDRILSTINYLTHQGIETRRWYCPPLTEHPAFEGMPQIAPNGNHLLKVTEELSHCLLGLPFHTSLNEEQIAYICSILKSTTN
ncbi:DegT/DnrJ/EryC1/StrS family aminotransferase [Candidatus Parabeggiatoa sp. HSG14]|uniref:DegT/DnrJ/EryC1/StrS family aminotransferase n=1 Tax=Candidatus Parabeggiatoa sp. HSG14 TaxID=3055593 RepID=UPI0025A76A3F|nr:DegT/DnrJ/EryC1/StrS family aminotransferase [Thiotrichales bacterium HSG14]